MAIALSGSYASMMPVGSFVESASAGLRVIERNAEGLEEKDWKGLGEELGRVAPRGRFPMEWRWAWRRSTYHRQAAVG